MSDQLITVRSRVAPMIVHLAAAIPAGARWTFTELLVGAAVTVSGHSTDAITAYSIRPLPRLDHLFLVRRARPLVMAGAVGGAAGAAAAGAAEAAVHPGGLACDPRRHRAGADLAQSPGVPAPLQSYRQARHTAKPNRPRFLHGQGWVCLAAVVERAGTVGAVPLMLRLVRARGNRGKLDLGRLMLRLLGDRLGRVRLLVDAWYMRARLIRPALQRGHCVIGRVRKDPALYLEPPLPTPGRRGRPRKYGARVTPEMVARLPVSRSARILYGKLEVVRYRTCCVAARFLKGALVRAIWVELERPDRPTGRTETRLLLCTDPLLPAIEVITAYSKRWAVEPLFFVLKHHWGLKDAWQRSRRALIRWVTILCAGYTLNQILACSDPADLGGLARPAPWRRKGEITAGIIRTGLDRILRQVGVATIVTGKSQEIDTTKPPAGYPAEDAALSAA